MSQGFSILLKSAGSHEGMALLPSKNNPKVKRWQKVGPEEPTNTAQMDLFAKPSGFKDGDQIFSKVPEPAREASYDAWDNQTNQEAAKLENVISSHVPDNSLIRFKKVTYNEREEERSYVYSDGILRLPGNSEGETVRNTLRGGFFDPTRHNVFIDKVGETAEEKRLRRDKPIGGRVKSAIDFTRSWKGGFPGNSDVVDVLDAVALFTGGNVSAARNPSMYNESLAKKSSKISGFGGHGEGYSHSVKPTKEAYENAHKTAVALASMDYRHTRTRDPVVYRGMSLEQKAIDALTEGDVINMSPISSWSFDMTVASDFMDPEDASTGVDPAYKTAEERAGILFHMDDPKYGADIARFSQYRDEQEFLTGGSIRVKSKQWNSLTGSDGEEVDGYFIVTVEQVKKPESLVKSESSHIRVLEQAFLAPMRSKRIRNKAKKKTEKSMSPNPAGFTVMVKSTESSVPPRPGMALLPSKENPGIKRWQKISEDPPNLTGSKQMPMFDTGQLNQPAEEEPSPESPSSSADERSNRIASLIESHKQSRQAQPEEAPSQPAQEEPEPAPTYEVSSEAKASSKGEEVEREAHVAKIKSQFKGYKQRSYEELFDENAATGMTEETMSLGQGMFGRAVIDKTHKDSDGKRLTCVVKYGVISNTEVDVMEKMGDIGVGPVLIEEDMGELTLDDGRLEDLERALDDVAHLMPTDDEEDEYTGDFKRVPQMHDSKNRHQTLVDFFKTGYKEATEEDIDNQIELLEYDMNELDEDDEDDEDQIAEYKEEIERLEEQKKADPIDELGLDEDVIRAVSESGNFSNMNKIRRAEDILERNRQYVGDYHVGARVSMELLEGYEPVGEYVLTHEVKEQIRGGDIDEPDEILSRLKICIGVLDKMNIMHDAGYVHNDLHGMNIMHDGDDVKLIDFGLAAQLRPGMNAGDWAYYGHYAENARGMLGHLDTLLEEAGEDAGEIPGYWDAQETVRDMMTDFIDFTKEHYSGHGGMGALNGSASELISGGRERIDKMKSAYMALEDTLEDI